MAKKCEICKEDIEDTYGKLNGTLLKLLDGGKNKFVYVCSECQKDAKWIETAKVKGA